MESPCHRLKARARVAPSSMMMDDAGNVADPSLSCSFLSFSSVGWDVVICKVLSRDFLRESATRNKREVLAIAGSREVRC